MWLALVAASLCAVPSARAQNVAPPNSATDLAPQSGEIALEGIVVSAKPNEIVINATAFSLPNGKRAELSGLKLKTVALQNAAIFPRGDAFWRLSATDIKPNNLAVVVGRDAGSGQVLPARAVALRRLDETGALRDYFVAQNGSDARGDGSPDKPWRTIQKGVDSMRDGVPGSPRILHIGPGEFAESLDGDAARLNIRNKNYLTITGAGARAGGTQISTGNFDKYTSGVLWIDDARELRICNLIIGDDRAWTNKNAFFEATVSVHGQSSVRLEAVELRGPSRETTLAANSQRAPTVLHSDGPDCATDLTNVLVSGHGTFLSNPLGRVSCRNVTFAGMFGLNYDDNVLFLQTPHGEPRGQRLYTFADCVFYEIQGSEWGNAMILSSGENGEDKAFFELPGAQGGGNVVTRARFDKDGAIYQAGQMAALFRGLRGGHFTLAHGVWKSDDTRAVLTGALLIDNDLQLSDENGFALVSPSVSGWHGGFAAPGEAG